MFPFDGNSVDYAAFTEFLTASNDDLMNDGAELLPWSVVAQSLLALFPYGSPDFSSPSFSSETSGSIFTEFELDLNSRPSEDDTNIVNEHTNTLAGDILETSPAESNDVAMGTSSAAISRYSLSPL